MVNARQPGGQLDLHFDGAGLEPEIGDSGDGRGHSARAPGPTVRLTADIPLARPCDASLRSTATASPLRERHAVAHIRTMISARTMAGFIDHPGGRMGDFRGRRDPDAALAVVGAIPGPGGIFVFAIGLAMVLKTSMWAKRHYVRFKRWQPKAGRWTDWGLRRRSARRREALRKEREERAAAAADGARREALEPDPHRRRRDPVRPAKAAQMPATASAD